MRDKQYIDIKVVDGGWHIDAGSQPELCGDQYSIAQDIKHAIMESGVMNALIAERNAALRADALVQIEQIAERDIRIIPGSATVKELGVSQLFLTATTYDNGELSVPVPYLEGI